MSVSFADSQTKINLMKAFAGEAQAQNRYTFAAGVARQESLYVIESLFRYTAGQELAHAKVFYRCLQEFSGESISIDACYPVDLYPTALEHLRAAQRSEYQEYNQDYTGYAHVAKDEGFPEISHTFSQIARIEREHGDRFARFSDLLEQGKLFGGDGDQEEFQWVCLNCGYTVTATHAPESCHVCNHPAGFFIRLEMTPFSFR